jgi:hypothetical protein
LPPPQPARIVSDAPMAGLAGGFCVMVPVAMLRRAEWVLSQAQLTDAELSFFATGELGDSPSP